MALQKSQTQDIQTVIGNGLAIYIDGNTNLLMIKDTNGAVKPLQDYFSASILNQDNIGRSLNIEEADLIEEPSENGRISQVATYLDKLNYEKEETDAELFFNVVSPTSNLTEFLASEQTADACFGAVEPLSSQTLYHDGEGGLPTFGDQIFFDPSGELPVSFPQFSAPVFWNDGFGGGFIVTNSEGIRLMAQCL